MSCKSYLLLEKRSFQVFPTSRFSLNRISNSDELPTGFCLTGSTWEHLLQDFCIASIKRVPKLMHCLKHIELKSTWTAIKIAFPVRTRTVPGSQSQLKKPWYLHEGSQQSLICSISWKEGESFHVFTAGLSERTWTFLEQGCQTRWVTGAECGCHYSRWPRFVLGSRALWYMGTSPPGTSGWEACA